MSRTLRKLHRANAHEITSDEEQTEIVSCDPPRIPAIAYFDAFFFDLPKAFRAIIRTEIATGVEPSTRDA